MQVVDINFFELIFHMAHYSLVSGTAITGPHHTSECQSDIDASFMLPDPRLGTVTLHKTQVSCVVKGVDCSRYRVLCLVDNSFFGDGGEEGDRAERESAHTYWSQEQEEGLQWNPLTSGRRLLDITPTEPRDFWLMNVYDRVQNALNQWKGIGRFFGTALSICREVLYQQVV